MQVFIDTREKERAIKSIKAYFKKRGVQHFSTKLFVGDYMRVDSSKIAIDRKQNLSELCSNVCQQHDRFRGELIRATEANIKLIILVEHGKGIKSLEDVIWWQNPREKVSKKAMSGDVLYKILCTLKRKYNVDFFFCDKKDTGKRILEILGEVDDDK